MAKKRFSNCWQRSKKPREGHKNRLFILPAERRAVFFRARRARILSMARDRHLALTFCCLLSAGLCHGTERIEIVLDASMGMWDSFPEGTPRIVAARTAINAFVVSPTVSDQRLEIALRTMGSGRPRPQRGAGAGARC